MTATLAHRRALAAVSRITFTLGLAGCIQPVESPDPTPTDGDAPDGEAWLDPDRALPDAGIEQDAAAHPDALPEDPDDLGEADLGAAADGGAGPDATPLTCDPAAEDWVACCDAIDWDPEQGCLAWGPPVPPRMPGEVA
ncbi:MAG: hypothetical protein H6702_25290 [Myxococcales bacterium]|nr:hypothetical protein [Myxococcales bacterium]